MKQKKYANISLITTSQVAAMLGCCTNTVRSLMFKGKLTPVRLGEKLLRFNRDEVEGLLLDSKKN